MPSPPRRGGARLGERAAFEQGMRDTRATLSRWRGQPGAVLTAWLAGALAISLGLLAAVWIVATLSIADPSGAYVAGIDGPIEPSDYGRVLLRNLLVLTLHAAACVAGYLAGSSLPIISREMSGLQRIVHERAGPLAIGWVVLVTTFSLCSQAYLLGAGGATIAAGLGIGPGALILTVLPHAVIELTAVFLPLSAWVIASRQGRWNELLAATVLTVSIAVPMLLVAAGIETFMWPRLLELVSPLA